MPDAADADRLIRALPCWQGTVRIAPLDGGMTNRNFRVDDGCASFVVRLGQDLPAHGIVRWHEQAVARAAHAAGVSPQVVHAGPGVLVSRFIDGQTLEAQQVRDPARRDAIVALLRRCHHDLPRQLRGPVLMFWVFQVIRDYLAVLQPHAPCLMQDQLPAWAAMARTLEQAVGPVDIVFGHNDLLAANLIDDGRRLWLIDWEYAGFNSPLFDLAGLAVNNGFDDDQARDLLEQYFRQPVDAGRWRSFAAMRCASALRETLWAVVSHHTSDIGVDHAVYARQCRRALDQVWRDFNR
ncbi:phosphotransferase [Comamonadaceae bacterium G21597-S1]|nr:phosphotransferase [Comamonadaceae bacterium G21597-S1]